MRRACKLRGAWVGAVVLLGMGGVNLGQESGVRLECAAIMSGGFVDSGTGAVFVLGQALVGVETGGGVTVEAGVVYCFGGGCAADWDGSGGVSSDDFFAFLSDFFEGEGDFDRDGVTDSDDFFAYLTVFFEGCA